MFGLIGGALSVIGNVVKEFFNFKGEQAKVITKALEVVSDVQASEDARAVAAAKIISSEARSESWLTRTWRPLTVLSFVGLLISHILGFTAVNLSEMILLRIFDIVEYSVLGYMGARTIDKLVRELSLGGVLKSFIAKKLG